MEANLKTNGVSCCFCVYSQTLHREESQDCVVPEALPDIREIINTCGMPLIRSKDVGTGRVRVEANVPVKVAFTPEEGTGVACLELNIPFFVSVEDEAITDECTCAVQLHMTALETRVLNPRKISVRAELAVGLECRKRGELSLCTAPEECGAGIHALERSVEVSPVCCVTEKTFVLTDELLLPQGKAPADEVIGRSVSLLTDDVKAVGTKLIVKGCAVSALLYKTVDGGVDMAEFSTPFSQIIDTDCETEEGHACVTLLLSGVYYDVPPVGDGKTINAEMHLVAQVSVRKNAQLTYLCDAYSNAYALELRREERKMYALRREVMLRETLRVQADTAQTAVEVLGCTVSVLDVSSCDDGAAVRLWAKVFCRSGDGGMFTVEKLCSAQLRAELRDAETLVGNTACVREAYAAPAAGGVELRLPVEVRGFAAQFEERMCVSGISYDENACRDLSALPTLTLMRFGSDADLWTIARENCSTVEAIREANALDSAGESWEKLLLIPKTV
ncbi:MAG: DUF3794 domain-containing protein [Ruminococcaceae bacterium]|nr:DUF3794 domain-containing protein [Oscillospiraceae bacterium]